jgi:hypothetical protein
MHPLVARIHPSLRTAFFAWLLCRTTAWTALFVRWSHGSDATFEPGVGAFAWHWITAFSAWSDRVYPMTGTIFLVGVGELLLFAACVGIYRYARRDGVPQTAERATWLWALSPLMIFAVPGQGWQWALALVPVAFALSASGRGVLGALAASLAIAIRPEVALVWPALAAEAWAGRIKDDTNGPLAVTLGVPAAFALSIFGTILFGDGASVLHVAADWRQWEWRGLHAHFADITVVAALSTGIVLHLRYATKAPRRLLLAIPCLVFPLLLTPSAAMAATAAFSAPTFFLLAKSTEDPAFERPLLAASLLAFFALGILA